METPTVVLEIYLPASEIIQFLIGFIALYILVRTAIKLTPFIG